MWALKCLDECVTQEASPTAVNLNDLMPTEWMRKRGLPTKHRE